MWSVFQLLFGFLIVGLASIWLSGLLLASIFPLFNYKAEFIEYYTKRTGAPPCKIDPDDIRGRPLVLCDRKEL